MKQILVDLSVLSSLLLIGICLRKKVRFLQNLYVPASLIAGFVGLLIGPQILGRISPVYLPVSDTLSSWAGQLVNIVLGLSFLGHKKGTPSVQEQKVSKSLRETVSVQTESFVKRGQLGARECAV